jgi:acyl carrier protein
MGSDYDEILQRLCHHLRKFCPPEVEITPQTNLIDQLAIDSVKLLNLIMEIEDEFDISVPLNALADVQTVHELANLVCKIKSTTS